MRRRFCCSEPIGLIFSLAHRPIANRYIRIDEMGRAQAIAYTDLNYSPREGEVRTYLTDWANYRYTISRDTIAKKYPLNYYFLVAEPRLAADGPGQPESPCLAGHRRTGRAERCGGQERHHYVDVRRRPFRAPRLPAGRLLSAIDKLYSPRNSREPQDGALGAQCHLLSESQTGERSGPKSSRNSRRSIRLD